MLLFCGRVRIKKNWLLKPWVLTAERLAKQDLVDEVLKEPLGGAHRDPVAMAETLKAGILRHLSDLERHPTQEVLEKRYKRLRSFGVFTES